VHCSDRPASEILAARMKDVFREIADPVLLIKCRAARHGILPY